MNLSCYISIILLFYSRSLEMFAWKYFSFIFKSDSFDDVNGNFADIESYISSFCMKKIYIYQKWECFFCCPTHDIAIVNWVRV